jgi:hypothetical protein
MSDSRRSQWNPMAFLIFLALATILVLFVTPGLLIRRPAYFGAEEDFASSDHVLPTVIQNSSVAYGVGLATLGPVFTWGANGDLWQAIVYTVFVGSGLSIIYILRRPILEFLADVLRHHRSITVHEFICRRHGDDQRVRAIATLLTMFALAGLMACEMLAVATALKPLLWDSELVTELFLAAILLVVTLCALWSGHRGTMHAAQLQLGLIYLGLFGSTAFLLYLQLSELGTVPARGRLAIALIAIVCTIMLVYRRVRYVDTNSIRYEVSAAVVGVREREPLPLRLVSRFGKILNVFIVSFIALVMGFSAVELYAAGIPIIADDALTLLANAHVSGTALIVLILWPLFHPIVDVVNWQRLAAFEKERGWRYFWEDQWTSDFRRFCATYAAEVPLVVFLICLFGTIAGLNLVTSERANVVEDLIVQLVAQDNFVATIVVALFLFSLFAIAVSTMSSLLVANLCTIQYDIVPMLRPKPKFMRMGGRQGTMIVAGTGVVLVVFAIFCLTHAHYGITLSSNSFLALVLGFSCLQISFMPLVLGPLIGGSGGGTVNPGWAIAVMGAGAVIGSSTVAAYLATGYDPWLWAAVPGCLGSSTLLFITAGLWPRLRSSLKSRRNK